MARDSTDFALDERKLRERESENRQTIPRTLRECFHSTHRHLARCYTDQQDVHLLADFEIVRGVDHLHGMFYRVAAHGVCTRRMTSPLLLATATEIVRNEN